MSDLDTLTGQVALVRQEIVDLSVRVRHGAREGSALWLPLLWEGDQA